MKRALIALALVAAMLSTAVQAQAVKSTTRLEKQHGQTRFQRAHLKQTEESLLPALRGELQGGQQMAIQTLRDLEQIYPDYSFAQAIVPLEALLKNEGGDPVARTLAALALDELHSDAGDAIIKNVAGSSDDKGLQSLCNALMIRSDHSMNAGAKE